MTVSEGVAATRRRIADAGGTADVQLIAVTKGFGADVVRAALDAGLTDLGESYAQEFVVKAEAVAADPAGSLLPTWHFIGRLQRNKVRSAAPHVALWHSVDREPLAAEIAKRAPGASVLIQVDATAEPSKGGCPAPDVPSLVAQSRVLGLDVRGLMCIGVLGDLDRTAEAFDLTARLADRLDLPERSMGMSGDLELAVEAGSTMVRVGTALFGSRPERPEVEH